MNMIIYGFKHSGKTAYARYLAEQLQVSYFDMDEILSDLYASENKRQLAAPDIYEIIGEEKFRNLEARALLTLSNVTSAIISASGGSLLNQDNIKIYKRLGRLIYLNANKEILTQREEYYHEEGLITPGEQKLKFEDIYPYRAKIYQSIADIMITVHDKPAEAIIEELKKYWEESR